MSKVARPISELDTYSRIPFQRLQSLYSDQSQQKNLSLDTYQSTVQWWSKTLEAYVTRGWQDSADVLVLHAGPDLPLRFRYEGIGRPLGMHTIIVSILRIFWCIIFYGNSTRKADLRNTQKLISLDRFLISQKSIYDQGSILYRFASLAIGKPLWWALQQLNVFDGEDTQTHESEVSKWSGISGSYVLIQSVEKAMEIVLRHQRNNVGSTITDSLHDYVTFKDMYGKNGAVFPDVELSDIDLRILIKFLSRDRNLVATDGKVGSVICNVCCYSLNV